VKTEPAASRRDQLAAAAAAYLLAHGVADLSLRPLAAACGTSARLLIYHFGSREQLLVEAMGIIRGRARAEVARMLAGPVRAADLPRLVRRFWRFCTARRQRPYLRLVFEVHGLALQDPDRYAGYLHGAISHWIELLGAALTAALGARRARATATLIVGVIDGLLMDYLSTGELRRTTEAMELFAAGLAARERKTR
jgi:AcrR family transcriptional regulator